MPISEKPPVINLLYDWYLAGQFPDGIVLSEDVVRAIRQSGVGLSTGNPANFFKDFIRKPSGNDNWPDRLKLAQITARQRYGNRRVFQFRPYSPGQIEPFPDRFLPHPGTPTQQIQSATLPFAARQLGRREESWLMQVVAGLNICATHLSIFSPIRGRLRDFTHLQMSMKTQPEIDGVYLASYDRRRGVESSDPAHVLVTVEAKQAGERILEDQIREQVGKAFSETVRLAHPPIEFVKPMAVHVAARNFGRAIHVVEFAAVGRRLFDRRYGPGLGDPESLYRMPLEAVSSALYELHPPVSGIG